MTTGVLLMAYGSPDSLDDVEPYLLDIRGGRSIRKGSLEDLTERYRCIGGRSPLLETTRAQADGVARALGPTFRVEIGMKHWRPTIADGMRALGDAGVDGIVGVALAPHYSSISIGGYESRARAAVPAGIPFTMVESWFDDKTFVDLVASNLRDALAGWPAEGTRVFFTAHSLPERIVAEGDPYVDQLLASAKLVAEAADAPEYASAFQSASPTGEPWLGPDLLDALGAFADGGGARAVVVPIGFVTDHLEILYDVDVEAAEHASRIGLTFRRVRSPNADPRLAGALANVIREVPA